MPRNGSGSYSRFDGVLSGSDIFVQQRNSATKILASRLDTEANDMATAISESIARDGQTTITANIPFAGFKPTNIALATARTDAARASQVQDGAFIYGGTSTNSGSDYSISLTPAISSYATGMLVVFRANATNGGATTLNINGVGAVAVRKDDGSVALVAGDIRANQFCIVSYDGTVFRLINRGAEEQLTAAGITFTGSLFSVVASTVDASDTAGLRLGGGGAIANGRGGRLELYGADHGSTPGQAILVGDNGQAFIGTSGAHPITLHTNGVNRFTVTSAGNFAPAVNFTGDLGTSSLHFANVYAANYRRNDGSNLQIMNDAAAGISLHTNGLSRFVLNSSGDLIADSTNGGDILIRNLTGNVVGQSSITATGSTQGTAAGINGTVQLVSSTGANQGVGLLSSRSGRAYYLLNTSANAVNVYPPVGGAINALAANAAISLPSGRAGLFICYGSGTGSGATGYMAIIGA